jgi:DNA-binding response OmpR family regulator
MKICIIEDNDVFRAMLKTALDAHGFDVTAVPDGEALDMALKWTRFEAFVVDLNLPGEDGLSISLRLKSAYPDSFIIMATAREGVSDRVSGYEKGADIYMTKPLHVKEVAAALYSLRRRIGRAQPQTAGFILDVQAAALLGPRGSEPQRLTQTEQLLLKGLAEAPNGLLEYWRIFDLLEKEADEAGKRALEVHIVNLRKKLVSLGAPRMAIRSVRNVGYRLVADLVVA